MKTSSNGRERPDRHLFRTAAILGTAAIVLLLLFVALLVFGRRSIFSDAAVLQSLPAATPVPSPTIAPTEPPAPYYTFIESTDIPLPGRLERLRLGEERTIDGVITCNYPLTSVTVMIICAYTEDSFYPYVGQVTFSPESSVKSYRLSDAASTREGRSLSEQIPFSLLKTGLHTLVISAACTQTGWDGDAPFQQQIGPFYVLGEDWMRVKSSLFSNDSYKTALQFFGGDTEKFLYRYQRVYDRYTVADPDWEAEYITEIKMDEGEPWRIHVDALPYYEKVRSYLNSAFIRVHGTNGDTGILPLSRLVVDYNGSYLSRYTSGLKYFSHHGFGAATDLNAAMLPNLNKKENLSVIDDEVRGKLAYNGILTENGRPYYDFTYSGTYACTDFGVPESVINYLLYEFAFYRAGFQWGHYYNSTSDGMHFTLTDNIKASHDDGKRGLRKVYEYYD